MVVNFSPYGKSFPLIHAIHTVKVNKIIAHLKNCLRDYCKYRLARYILMGKSDT